MNFITDLKLFRSSLASFLRLLKQSSVLDTFLLVGIKLTTNMIFCFMADFKIDMLIEHPKRD